MTSDDQVYHALQAAYAFRKYELAVDAATECYEEGDVDTEFNSGAITQYYDTLRDNLERVIAIHEKSGTTLQDFVVSTAPTYLWLVSAGHPAGIEWRHGKDDDDHVDFSEFEFFLHLVNEGLCGEVNPEGLWEWDGNGSPKDANGNDILNLKVGWVGTPFMWT